jgi:ABC-type Na+ efflux pump permease subunit
MYVPHPSFFQDFYFNFFVRFSPFPHLIILIIFVFLKRISTLDLVKASLAQRREAVKTVVAVSEEESSARVEEGVMTMVVVSEEESSVRVEEAARTTTAVVLVASESRSQTAATAVRLVRSDSRDQTTRDRVVVETRSDSTRVSSQRTRLSRRGTASGRCKSSRRTARKAVVRRTAVEAVAGSPITSDSCQVVRFFFF